ncbi:MAG: helix-turn-helix transcriptional regulator [bacterium]
MERILEESQLGRNLRALRIRAGLTQKQLADLARLDRATISLIENGRESPRAHTVVTLAEVLGVRPADLWRERSIGLGPSGAMATGRVHSTVGEGTETVYEPLEQHVLHPGLEGLLSDDKTRTLMQITDEEEAVLRSIRTRLNAPLDKEFFIDVLLAYRRSHSR